MKKDFNEFLQTISQEEINSIQNDLLNNIKDDNLFTVERTINLSLTLKLLEKYHNWLNN